MRLTDVFATAWNNIKGRKKTGRLLFFLLFLTLCIYMSVNSIALAVSDATHRISGTPDMRLIVYNCDDETLYADLKDACADMERVADVYPFVFELPVEAEGVEEEQRTELGVWSYSKEYEDYIVEGKAPKEGEILLPHYMFATTDGNYEDGSEYIGKSITIYITDMLEKEHSMTCKVSGTYNNINAVTDGYIVLMYPQDAVTLDEWQWCCLAH